MILLIDDDPSGVRVRQLLLESRGYEALTAETGAAGLEVFEREPVDLVVLDLGLPDLDGSEVLRRMKAAKPETPVVVLSGQMSVQSEVENLADAVLIKGAGAQKLLDAVAKQLASATA